MFGGRDLCSGLDIPRTLDEQCTWKGGAHVNEPYTSGRPGLRLPPPAPRIHAWLVQLTDVLTDQLETFFQCVRLGNVKKTFLNDMNRTTTTPSHTKPRSD